MIKPSKEALALGPSHWTKDRPCLGIESDPTKDLWSWLFNGSVWQQESSHPATTPPAKVMPESLRDAYTLYGQIRDPLLYKDDATPIQQAYSWGYDEVEMYMKQARNRTLNVSYPQEELTVVIEAFERHASHISGSRGLVVGSVRPWLESIALHAGASSVHTFEYSSINSSHPQLSASTPDTMESFMRNQFDWAASYSSVEHDGLGRYGDALDPFADLKTMAKLSCVLRPGGLMFLGVPWGPDAVVWNAHRIYGPLRTSLLLENFRVVDVVGGPWIRSCAFCWDKTRQRYVCGGCPSVQLKEYRWGRGKAPFPMLYKQMGILVLQNMRGCATSSAWIRERF